MMSSWKKMWTIRDSNYYKRVKRFAIKPMDVEEACRQMELLGT